MLIHFVTIMNKLSQQDTTNGKHQQRCIEGKLS